MASPNADVEGSLSCLSLNEEDGYIPFEIIAVTHEIGQGNFGRVMKADYNGTDVAVKEVFQIDDFDAVKYFEREVQLLMTARHPHVLQCMGYSIHDNRMYIVSEYMPNGDLATWIRDSARSHSWAERVGMASDAAKALAYLHARNIIHRDLKPSNFLLTETMHVKLADFGFSRKTAKTLDEKRRLSFCGTDQYMSPEIMLETTYGAQVNCRCCPRQCMDCDERSDIFSFGVVLCELIWLKVATDDPYLDREVPGFTLRVRELTAAMPDDCPVTLLALALHCTQYEPADRPSAKEVVRKLKDIERLLPSTHAGQPYTYGTASATPQTDQSRVSTVSTPSVELDVSAVNGSRVLTTKDVQTSNKSLSPAPARKRRVRVMHDIPHRFSTYLVRSKKSCGNCRRALPILYKARRCEDCHVYCHEGCEAALPPNCQLTDEQQAVAAFLCQSNM